MFQDLGRCIAEIATAFLFGLNGLGGLGRQIPRLNSVPASALAVDTALLLS